ncbi:MAG: aminomethyl-transferring glycine dehydrogenase subunit GcvPA [Rhodospirillales bacterium]|nr:MAG: aminomethyl-transferring glycine dehydrogenase subunit GcvPA [Rhodospirillales bacterium]
MRYLPLTDADRALMLKAVGAASVDDLFRDVPAQARQPGPLPLPKGLSEMEAERRLSAMAGRNMAASDVPCFLGAGAYRHHIPAAIDQLLLRGEFLTAYTPYQPEISQGTLQYLFEFQTQVAMITGMEVANASLYDGATACAEAALMSARVTKRAKVLMSGGVHPHYREVTATQARFTHLEVEALAPDPFGIEDLMGRIDSQTACVIVQLPGFFGHLKDYSALAKTCEAQGALLVVAVTEPVALGLIKPPGEMGADIVIGDGASLGVGLNFGGPGLGLMAVREKYVRQMPGRLIGETVDADGKRGWVLTLSTREQHIRREKATSNICTNSGLCALAFSMHMTFLGEAGFTKLARLNHARAVQLAERLSAIKGVKVLPGSFFNEFAVQLPKPATPVVEAMAARRILAGVPVSRFYPSWAELENVMLITATETVSDDDVDALIETLSEVLS